MAKLQITINEDGSVEIENQDVSGPGCTGIADKLAAAVGQKQEQDLKAEYYDFELPDYAEVGEE